ncbi:MAG TPA: FAD-binding oxidoreductase [Solirubrobacterales bacterium]|nr:FAD-binding oxidoreductase [Solirubrobacterales bacterium]
MEHARHGYWLQEVGEVEPCPALEGERSVDVVILGGGYTGMWAAWQLKALETGVRVALLEAETCGHGPSGRNGGFCNVMWFSLPNMRERWGDGAALAVARASAEAVAGIESFCREQEVDAWFRRGGYLQVSTAPAHDRAWAEALSACRALGEVDAVAPLDAAGVAARCASPAFRGGAFYPDAATVQPARLALGLRARLLDAGVEIFERSRVRSLHGGPDGVEARTAAGTVRARRAIVALGGAVKAPAGPLRNALTVTSSHIVLTEPVPDVLEEVGWTGGECITDSRALIDYFRTTPDGRIAFGWGGGRIVMGARLRGRAEVDPEVTAAAAERLYEYFPSLAEAGPGRKPARISHAWGGPIDVSPTHLPLIVPLSGDRVFVAAGYTGNGVGPSHMVGRALASLALDRRDAHSRLPFIDASPQRVPPEPFHWLGGEVIRRALNRKEEAELASLRPDLVSALISRIPRLIGFHIGR